MVTDDRRNSSPFASRSARVAVIVIATVATLVAAELALRMLAPGLGADVFRAPATPDASPFIYNRRVGYELKPHVVLAMREENRGPVMRERVNGDGFRGPDYPVGRDGAIRILAVGDSVVQGFAVSEPRTWERILERRLSGSSSGRVEVLNAGIGGYASWQIPARLQDHGFKYAPDLVVVLVGWNDLLFASTPRWTPGIDLSSFDDAFATPPPVETANVWNWIRGPLYRRSYVARLVREGRNAVRNAWAIQKLIERHQQPSGVPFNDRALTEYANNLERIHSEIVSHDAQMAVVAWPLILSPDLIDDDDVHRRIVQTYTNFPLSTRELFDWYQRYLAVVRRLPQTHPDVVLVDAAAAFAPLDKPGRLAAFVDIVHLTVLGNQRLADTIGDSLQTQHAFD